jgi:hypothetical protein
MTPNAPHRLAALAISAIVWLLSSLPQPSRAAGPVRLSVVPPLPCSAEELEQAVAARVAVASTGVRTVVVGPAENGVIPVRFGDEVVKVAVGPKVSAAAARVVALVIADLTAEELAPPRAPPALTGARAAPAAVSFASRLRLGAVALLARGTGPQEPTCYGLETDVTLRSAGRLELAAAVGLLFIPHRNAGRPDELSYTAGRLRVQLGWRLDPFELLAGPFVSPYALGGVTEHAGVLVGAGATARLAAVLSPRLRLVIGLRVDGYVNRIHAGFPGFATPRVDGAFGLGVAWDFGS